MPRRLVLHTGALCAVVALAGGIQHSNASAASATGSDIRFGTPEMVRISTPEGSSHFWFPNNGAKVGGRLVLPIRLTCDTPCYNASSGAHSVIVWRSSSADFQPPARVAPKDLGENQGTDWPLGDGAHTLIDHAARISKTAPANWSIAEQVPSLTGHTVPWFSSTFLGTGTDDEVTTTVQPHRALSTGPHATAFVGHATRWAENRTTLSRETVTGNVSYSVTWRNISSLDGCGQIARLQDSGLIQSVNFNTVGSKAMGVAAFGSENGLQWHWLAVAALPADLPDPATGAGETGLAVLSDGSVLIVIRTGNGFHARDALYATRSTRSPPGTVWSKPTTLRATGPAGSDQIGPWGVKPTLLQVPQGPLLLATGRPGLFLWASYDNGRMWSAYNLAAAHNAALSVADSDRFSDECVAAAVQSPGEAETTAYTSLVASVNGATAVVCYDRLALGWFGSQGNHNDRIYCLPLWTGHGVWDD